jgi:hypothetical protein
LPLGPFEAPMALPIVLVTQALEDRPALATRAASTPKPTDRLGPLRPC